MNTGMWIPFALVASADKSRRSRLIDAMIPAMVPLPPTQQVAVSAIAADRQVRNAERGEQRAAVEVVSAIETAIAKSGPDKTLTPAELSALPTLSQIMQRTPALHTLITTLAVASDQRRIQLEAELAEQAVNAVAELSRQYQAAGAVALRLATGDLQRVSPRLDAILTDPTLRARIEVPPP